MNVMIISTQTVKIAIELGEAEKEKNDVNQQVTRDCAIHWFYHG